MYTEYGYLVYVPSGFAEGNLMLFVSDEEYWDWLTSQDT